MINRNEFNLFNNSKVFSKDKIFKIFNEQFSDDQLKLSSLEEKMMFMDTINYLPNDILFKVIELVWPIA